MSDTSSDGIVILGVTGRPEGVPLPLEVETESEPARSSPPPPDVAPAGSSLNLASRRSATAMEGARTEQNQGDRAGEGTRPKERAVLQLSSDVEEDLDLPPPTSLRARPLAARLEKAGRPRAQMVNLSTSEDLTNPGDLWDGLPAPVAGPSKPRGLGGHPVARSVSLTGGSSTSTSQQQISQAPHLQRAHTLGSAGDLENRLSSSAALPLLSSSPSLASLRPFGPAASSSSPARTAAHRQLASDPFSDLRTPKASTAAAPEPVGQLFRPSSPKASSKDRERDPWAEILGGGGGDGAAEQPPVKGGKAPGRARGKGKVVVAEDAGRGGGGTRKRSISVAVGPDGEEEEEAQAERGKRGQSARSTAGLSKTEQKKLETAARVKLREANTLRAGDKKVSTAELTMHLSGTAFRAAGVGAEGDVAENGGGAGRKGKNARKATKSSPWLDIARDVAARLQHYACAVEYPDHQAEGPRGVAIGEQCEGAVRWTRACDRKWSEERRMYLPLEDGERLVVEENSRLIFLSAHDLSAHVAASTLSSYITTLQSRLPSQVNLLIMLYGLNGLARDLERARQEAYRNQVRATGAAAGAEADEAAGSKAPKRAGIGEYQPSKDELELALIRLQMQTRCMLVYVDSVSDAVDWLEQITFDVGQKPYQRLKHSHIALLGTSEDKVVSGRDLQDTYIKMLASLPRVTEAVAKGIVAEYPTVRRLYEAWEACTDERERREMLVGIGKGRNLDGTSTHRAIGKDLSALIYRVFCGRDPEMYL